MQSPFLLLIFRLGRPENTSSFTEALRTAFGVNQMGGTLDVVQLLNVGELREFNPRKDTAGQYIFPTDIVRSIASSAGSVLAVILDADSSTPSSPARTNFEQSLEQSLNGIAHATILSLYLNVPDSLFPGTPASFIRFGLADLDERDLRLPFFTLHVLNQALRLLANLNGKTTSKPARLFFSHAKRDGVQVATAVGDWMKQRLKGFESYYDTKDLDLDRNIDDQLANAIQNAVIIIFRTEAFDQRYWCQKEALWAEKYRRPVVAVDARWQLQHGASVISFDSVPAVRVPDGSFARIFTAALHEAVRIELFQARVNIRAERLSGWNVTSIPRCPSLVSLNESVETLGAAPGGDTMKCCIVYPNPALPEMSLIAGRNLARASAPGCELVSLDEFTLI